MSIMTKTIQDLALGYPRAWAEFVADLEEKLGIIEAEIVKRQKQDVEIAEADKIQNEKDEAAKLAKQQADAADKAAKDNKKD